LKYFYLLSYISHLFNYSYNMLFVKKILDGEFGWGGTSVKR